MSNATIQYHDCPHCYSHVMFRQDGICPSCRKNRLDTLHVDQDKTMVTIDHNHQLPGACFLCGVDTSQAKHFSWSYDKGTAPNLLARLLSYIPGSPHRENHQVDLPVCTSCIPSAKRVKPLSVLAGLECRLVVHRHFRVQFEQLNGKEYMEWQAEIRLTEEPKTPETDGGLIGDVFAKLGKI